MGGTHGAVDEMASGSQLRGVAMVSLAHLCSYYAMIGAQVNLKSKDVSPEAKNIADRAVVNTLEQTWPFLLALWVHACFVNPVTSVPLGWFYVVLRFFYP